MYLCSTKYVKCKRHELRIENIRILQEYFQPKIGRKIGIFNRGRKNDILKKMKECISFLLLDN